MEKKKKSLPTKIIGIRIPVILEPYFRNAIKELTQSYDTNKLEKESQTNKSKEIKGRLETIYFLKDWSSKIEKIPHEIIL